MYFVNSYFIFPGSKEAEFISIVFICQGTSTSFTIRWGGWAYWGPLNIFPSSWTPNPSLTKLEPHGFGFSNTPFPTQDVFACDSLGPGCTSTHTGGLHFWPALERGMSWAPFLKQALLFCLCLRLWFTSFGRLTKRCRYFKDYYIFAILNNYNSWKVSLLWVTVMFFLLSTCISRTV